MSSKKTTSETLDVVPDPSLFGKLGARSKALPMVVTELVDNSLDSWILLPSAHKKGKTLEVRIIAGSIQGSAFTITDNAGGMTLSELQSAMTIAKSEKGELSKGDKKLLGFYGFGLKSAAMFIGDEFSIYSQSYKEKNLVHFVDFDREKFEGADKDSRWKLEFQTMSADQAAKLEVHFPDGHGTIIRIKNKRYRPASQYAIIERLRKTFAPRLPCDPRVKAQNREFSNEEMKIFFVTRESKSASTPELKALGAFYTYWDGDKKDAENFYADGLRRLAKASDADTRSGIINELAHTDIIKGGQKDERGDTIEAVLPALKWLDNIPGWKQMKPFTVAGKRVRGRVGILDRGMGHTSEYGFDLIKNGRVIESFAKDPEKKKGTEQLIGLVANNHNARIIGQLFLDDWETDHQKTEFIKEADGWSKRHGSDEKTIAEHVYRFLKDEGYLSASYNLQSPRSAIPGARESEATAERLVAEKISESSPAIESKISRVARSSNVAAQLQKIEKAAPATIQKELKRLEVEKPTSNSKLQVTKPEIQWVKKGSGSPMYSVRRVDDKKTRRLIVTLNLDHPFVKKRESGEIKVIGELLMAEAFASYMATEKLILGSGFDHFVALRDDLLRETS